MKKTIRQIAQEAGVSITTVSRVINGDFDSVSGETRQRIEAVVAKYNYVGAKKKEKTVQNRGRETIAIVVPDLKQMFFSNMVAEAEKFCNDNGYVLQVFSSRYSDERESEILKKLVCEDIMGILHMSTANLENCLSDIKNSSSVPIIVLDNNLNEYKNKYNYQPAVFVNGEDGVYRLTNYLIEKGHKEIAYLSGVGKVRFNNNRYQGYAKALLENDLSVDPSLTAFGEFTFESGQQGVEKILQQNKKFTALVCENDFIAIGAMKKLGNMGYKVPEDISVVGFDNIILDEMISPRLTSMEQHIDKIIEHAMDMLIKISNGENIEKHVVQISPDIVERDSVRNLISN